VKFPYVKFYVRSEIIILQIHRKIISSVLSKRNPRKVPDNTGKIEIFAANGSMLRTFHEDHGAQPGMREIFPDLIPAHPGATTSDPSADADNNINNNIMISDPTAAASSSSTNSNSRITAQGDPSPSSAHSPAASEPTSKERTLNANAHTDAAANTHAASPTNTNPAIGSQKANDNAAQPPMKRVRRKHVMRLMYRGFSHYNSLVCVQDLHDPRSQFPLTNVNPGAFEEHVDYKNTFAGFYFSKFSRAA
jgi:hypothetical protein